MKQPKLDSYPEKASFLDFLKNYFFMSNSSTIGIFCLALLFPILAQIIRVIMGAKKLSFKNLKPEKVGKSHL
jgi:hypothetical protein